MVRVKIIPTLTISWFFGAHRLKFIFEYSTYFFDHFCSKNSSWIRNKFGQLFHFCTSNLWKSFTSQVWSQWNLWCSGSNCNPANQSSPPAHPGSNLIRSNKQLKWIWSSFTSVGHSKPQCKYMSPESLRKYWRNDFEVGVQNHLSKTVATLFHQPPKLVWLKDFVVCRLMTDHEHQTLKIISKCFEMILNIGKWLPISFCRWFQSHDGSAEMISGVGVSALSKWSEVVASLSWKMWFVVVMRG